MTFELLRLQTYYLSWQNLRNTHFERNVFKEYCLRAQNVQSILGEKYIPLGLFSCPVFWIDVVSWPESLLLPLVIRMCPHFTVHLAVGCVQKAQEIHSDG